MRALALAVAVIILQRDVSMTFKSSLDDQFNLMTHLLPDIASALVLLVEDVVDDVVVELVVDLHATAKYICSM